jgi:hypothetical protein
LSLDIQSVIASRDSGVAIPFDGIDVTVVDANLETRGITSLRSQ